MKDTHITIINRMLSAEDPYKELLQFKVDKEERALIIAEYFAKTLERTGVYHGKHNQI